MKKHNYNLGLAKVAVLGFVETFVEKITTFALSETIVRMLDD
jgi:hypothetical protein